MWTYLGQNFLVDMKIRDFIVEKTKKLYDEMWCEALVEIGIWKWVLTKKICQISNNFFVIEYDKILVDNINAKPEDERKIIVWDAQIILSDVLLVDLVKVLEDRWLDPKRTLIVGNLPYYITSPIFRKFFEPDEMGGCVFPWGVFMVQHEVGDRISEDTDKKSFLRWILNYGYNVKYLKWVPAKCFKPAPKVKSAVVQLTIKNEKLKINYGKLFEFLDLYNGFARKTLGKIEKMVSKKNQNWFVIPEELKSKRLEELDWDGVELITNR
jgi:16S rRNA (adenine1518-N6/adenine1519-N6)-dimethyltransferase